MVVVGITSRKRNDLNLCFICDTLRPLAASPTSRSTLAQQANGIDTGWMLPLEHQDDCEGFRQSSFDSRVYFAVSEVSWERRY